MKKLTFSIVVLSIVSLTSLNSFAQEKLGIGGELISPVGLSYKISINEKSAITGAFGFFLSDGFNNAILETNYTLYRDNENINIGSGQLHPYFGGGLAFNFATSSDVSVALRVPFGIEYKIDSTPIEIYMDVGPYLVLTDPLSFSLDSSLGFRYRF
jgi:hypothetical protein